MTAGALRKKTGAEMDTLFVSRLESTSEKSPVVSFLKLFDCTQEREIVSAVLT